ncbi:cysteine proteinase [Coprinopsis marcescibilis]|uniref:Cysteine proteinase n=1 Tax=Coprinopsis marcescibilis TaxID=230819 RepID=A0A5C3LAV1_COPMA|nr:cysteine proteinase [Coprinopsis marcescibilis]
MANSKKNRAKKSSTPLPPPPIANDDEDDLMNDLLSQLENADKNVQAESAKILDDMHLNEQAEQLEKNSKASAKDRFKARQARKAAALAQAYSPDDPAAQAVLERAAKEEADGIEQMCKELNVVMHQVNPDGHCLFSALADQFAILGIVPPEQANYTTIRAAAANYILTHPDDFLPFLPAIENSDNCGLMTPQQFQAYCDSVRSTALWGGEPEIQALSRAFNVSIHVIQGEKPSIVAHEPNGPFGNPGQVARLSYHRRMYGLGEHYNSLRPQVKQAI